VRRYGTSAAGDPSPDWCFLRYDFDAAPGPVTRATLAITASSTRPALQYVYRAHLNGTVLGVGPTRPLGDESRYETYDLTELLRVIVVLLNLLAIQLRSHLRRKYRTSAV
jgi:alpha-L-rhamnosidase